MEKFEIYTDQIKKIRTEVNKSKFVKFIQYIN